MRTNIAVANPSNATALHPLVERVGATQCAGRALRRDRHRAARPGNVGFQGLGEADVRRCMEMTKKLLSVDNRRVLLMG